MINIINPWFKVVRKTLNLQLLVKVVFGHLLLFCIVYYFTGFNLLLSFVILLMFVIIRSAINIYLFYKELIRTNSYDLILLKPVNPLVSLIIYNKDITDVFLLLFVLLYLRIKMIKK